MLGNEVVMIMKVEYKKAAPSKKEQACANEALLLLHLLSKGVLSYHFRLFAVFAH